VRTSWCRHGGTRFQLSCGAVRSIVQDTEGSWSVRVCVARVCWLLLCGDTASGCSLEFVALRSLPPRTVCSTTCWPSRSMSRTCRWAGSV